MTITTRSMNFEQGHTLNSALRMPLAECVVAYSFLHVSDINFTCTDCGRVSWSPWPCQLPGMVAEIIHTIRWGQQRDLGGVAQEKGGVDAEAESRCCESQ